MPKLKKPGLEIFLRPGSPFYYLRGTVRGQRVKESTKTSDPERARIIAVKREEELWTGSVFGRKAVVTFASAVERYLTTEERSEATKALVKRLLNHFGTKPLHAIDQDALDDAYGKLLTPKAGPATKTRAVLTPLRAIMECAAVRGWCPRPSFEKPKIGKTRTDALTPPQVVAVIREAAPHLRPLLVFLFGTGARMSEALELDWSRLDLFGARAKVKQKQGTIREIDLPPVVVAALSALREREGRVFRPARHNSKRLAEEGYRSTGRAGGGQIKTAWASALDRAGVPYVKPHAMRHTWASWQYCLHRDLVRLQEEGGWETIGMVRRYAKRMPDAYKAQIKAWFSGRAVNLAERRTA